MIQFPEVRKVRSVSKTHIRGTGYFPKAEPRNSQFIYYCKKMSSQNKSDLTIVPKLGMFGRRLIAPFRTKHHRLTQSFHARKSCARSSNPRCSAAASPRTAERIGGWMAICVSRRLLRFLLVICKILELCPYFAEPCGVMSFLGPGVLSELHAFSWTSITCLFIYMALLAPNSGPCDGKEAVRQEVIFF